MLRLGAIRLRHRGHVNGVAFSPDGKRLASAGWDNSIRIWDVDTGRPLQRLATDKEESNYGIAFSPDGKKLAATSERGMVRLWNTDTGTLISEVLGHTERSYGVRVYGVAFAPDGLSFATAGDDTSIRLWDAATGAELLELQTEEEGGDARPVTFSPDGNLLASGSATGKIYIWNLAEGGEPQIINKAHERDITALTFTADGKQLISSGLRFEHTGERSVRSISQIHVWDVSSGEKQPGFQAEEELEGHCTIAVSADGQLLVSAHHQKIVIWNVETRKPKRIISGDEYYGGRTHGIAISPDNGLVAAATFGSGTNKIYLWNVETGEPFLPQEEAHADAVLAIDVAPDGQTVVTGSADDTVRLWNAATGEHGRLLDRGTGWVRYAEFSPNGHLIALGRETWHRERPRFEGELKTYTAHEQKLVHHFRVPDRVMCGAISPDGKWLAAGIGLTMPFREEPSEPKIIVWELESGNQATELVGHTSQIQNLQFRGEEMALWSSGEDGTLRKWDPPTGEELLKYDLATFLGQRRFGGGPQLLDESKFIMGILDGVDRNTVRGKLLVGNMPDNELQWERVFPDLWPPVVAVSPDRRLAATFLRRLSHSKGPPRLVLWSTSDGQELLSFEMEDSPVRALAFSPDGKLLLSGMAAGDTLVWDVTAARAQLPKVHE